MTRYGDDDRDAYDDTLQPNALCTDCGSAFSRAEDDPGPLWCDSCSNRRDAWAAALELRLMAKAVLRSDPAQIKDVA